MWRVSDLSFKASGFCRRNIVSKNREKRFKHLNHHWITVTDGHENISFVCGCFQCHRYETVKDESNNRSKLNSFFSDWTLISSEAHCCPMLLYVDTNNSEKYSLYFTELCIYNIHIHHFFSSSVVSLCLPLWVQQNIRTEESLTFICRLQHWHQHNRKPVWKEENGTGELIRTEYASDLDLLMLAVTFCFGC